jgi:hypothetical protein
MAAPEVIAESPLMQVRNSDLHGLGVFATQDIKKGTRIIEYLGDHISHAEADRRYESKDDSDNHTFLFSVDRKLVIDAGVNGNDARYFNHSCDPNCESVIENRRVFIEAIKDIAAGDEMTYDYQIGREKTDPPNIDEIYACKCGAKNCRGTMLWPAKRQKAKAKKKAAAKSAVGKKAAGKKGAGKKSVGKTAGKTAVKKGAAGKTAAKTGASSKVAASRKSGGAKSKVSAPGKGSAKKGVARGKTQSTAAAPNARAKKKASAKGKRR